MAVTRVLEFDAAHRVPGHEGKCRHLHGHRYKVELTAKPHEGLDRLGRVIDFGALKQIVGGWIDETLDHNVLLWERDPLCNVLHQSGINERSAFLMKGIPTAENIAEMLYHKSVDLLRNTAVAVTCVRVWETPNCYAEYAPEDEVGEVLLGCVDSILDAPETNYDED